MTFSHPFTSLRRATVRGVVTLAVVALPGLATALTCTEVGSEQLTRIVTPGSNALGPIQGPPGFKVRVSTTNTPAIGVEVDGVEGGKFNCTGAGLFSETTQECTQTTLTDDGDGTMSYEAFSNADASITFTCEGTGTTGGGTDEEDTGTTEEEDTGSTGGGNSGTTTTTTTTTTPNAPPPGPSAAQVAQSVTRGAQTSARGSTGAVGTATRAATLGRMNGGGSLSVSTNSAFLSTMSAPGGATLSWNGWLSVDRREFSGDADGSRTDLIVGFDTAFNGGDTIAGVFIGNETLSLDDGVVDLAVTGLSFGPYFAHRIGAIVIDGHLGFARPEYDIDGTDYEAERVFGAVTVSGSAQFGALSVTPFATLSSFREDHPDAVIAGTRQPDRTVSATSASLGARVDFGDLGGLAPYVSLAGDYSRFDDGLGTEDEFTSGRYGLGFVTTGGPGTLSFDVDFGEQVEGIEDVGVRLNYAYTF